MPATVALATNRVPADISAAMTALKIEAATNSHTTLCGLGIDLVRCFNTLPRGPICAAMERMGVPKAYITAWSNMLSHMTRTLLVGMTQGEPCGSTTGAPEGCGMSVVAMATTSWWVIKILEFHHPTTEPSCFADNWQVLSEDPKILREATATMQDFVSHMKMAIAPNKSYLWATTRSARKKLTGILVGKVAIPVVTNYSDLGCDIHCSRKVVKPKSTKRLNKAKRIFKRIPFSTVPKNFKMRLAKGAGFAAANYGSALQWTPHTTWRGLRASVARSLALMYPAASSWLAASVTTGDPQCHHLNLACCFWRRFIRTFPEHGRKFLEMVSHVGVCRNGPAANFRRTLKDCGWEVQTDPAIIRHTCGLQVNWVNCSKKCLNFRLTTAWNYIVNDNIRHRKDCGDGIPDFSMANEVLSKLTSKDQWTMRVLMSGKQFSHDILSKFAPDLDKHCPLCGKLDSKKHRIFDCKALEKVRKKHRKTICFASKQPKVFRLLGLPVVQGSSWIKLSQDDSIPSKVSKIHDGGGPRHFFLDGSAYHQDVRELVISGWAIIESRPGDMHFSLIDSGVVPGGEHSSYRGEAMSLLRALEQSESSYLYSDCQAVVDTFHALQSAIMSHAPCPSTEHSDIWDSVWSILVSRDPQAHTMMKVKAHQKIMPFHGVLDKWTISGNNAVDEAAKAAVRSHPSFSTLATEYKARKRYKQQYCNYVRCLCDLAAETFSILSQKQAKHSFQASQQAPTDFNMWLVPASGLYFHFPTWEDLGLSCPFEKTFFDRVAAWFSSLQWPQAHTARTQGVSLLELYVDFVVYSQSESPINDQKKGFKANYYLLDGDPLLQEAGAPLHKHTKSWMTFWKWVVTNQVVDAPIVWDDPKPISHVGYSLRGAGFTVRPRLTNNEITMRWLWAYFHPSSGRRRNLSAPLRPWYK